MLEKIKISSIQLENAIDVVMHPHFHASVAFMGAAAFMGIYSHSIKQPLMATETVSAQYSPGESSHEERRQSEVHPRHRGHSVEQRTPPISGNA